MERKTYAGHGKPETFLFGGLSPQEPDPFSFRAEVRKLDKGLVIWNLETNLENVDITGNTKFWAEVPAGNEPTSSDVTSQLRRQVDLLADANETYKAQLADARELAAGFESKVNALEAELAVERGDKAPEGDTLSIPAEGLDAVLDEMEEAMKAAQREVEKGKRQKASSGDRRRAAFHSGVAKTLAYFLPKLDELSD
jgi:hypothetical protein